MKKIKKKFNENIDEKYNMNDRLDYIKSQITFNKKSDTFVIHKRKFAIATIFAAVLLISGSAFSTYLITKSNMEFKEVYVSDNENHKKAFEYIDTICVSRDNFPIASYSKPNQFILYFYKGIQNQSTPKTLVFYQICLLRNDNNDFLFHFILENGETSFINVESNFMIGEVNIDYTISGELSFDLYNYDELTISSTFTI